MSDKKIPTWGYQGDRAELFQLEPGQSLPSGWFDSPAKTDESAPVDEVQEPEQVDEPELEAEPEAVEPVDLEVSEEIEIPEDWAETGAGTHFKRIKLAKLLQPEMAELIKTDADAIEIIEAELVSRGANDS